jgi:hypothetical protein
MKSSQLRPCPLCSGLAPRWPLVGNEEYNKILCPRCGTFIVEPTLPALPWVRLAPDDIRLVVFLPGYIRHQNQQQHEPLLTLENWRTFACRGRMMALAEASASGRLPVSGD